MSVAVACEHSDETAEFASLIRNRVADKASRGYPPATTLLVNCDLGVVVLETEWEEIVRAVSSALLCRQSGAQEELLEALKGLGQIERDLGHGDAARPRYEEAVAICRRGGDPLRLAHTIRHLGDIHQDADRLELAEPCYHEALALYRSEKRSSPLDLANAIRPFAMLKEKRGEVEEAGLLWVEARDLYAAVNVKEGVAECSARLGRLRR